MQSVFRSKDYTTVWFDTAPSARPFPVLTKLEGLSYNATDGGKLANCNPTGIIHKYTITQILKVKHTLFCPTMPPTC